MIAFMNSKHAGQHPLSTKVGLPEMPTDGRTQLRQGFREFDEPLKLLRFLCARVILMVEVLPAASCIFANCLQPATRQRVDSNFCPCRRNYQIAYPGEIRSTQPATIGFFVAETSLRRAGAYDARLLKLFNSRHWTLRADRNGNRV
jgi:hypothetical protein